MLRNGASTPTVAGCVLPGVDAWPGLAVGGRLISASARCRFGHLQRALASWALGECSGPGAARNSTFYCTPGISWDPPTGQNSGLAQLTQGGWVLPGGRGGRGGRSSGRACAYLVLSCTGTDHRTGPMGWLLAPGQLAGRVLARRASTPDAGRGPGSDVTASAPRSAHAPAAEIWPAEPGSMTHDSMKA